MSPHKCFETTTLKHRQNIALNVAVRKPDVCMKFSTKLCFHLFAQHNKHTLFLLAKLLVKPGSACCNAVVALLECL